MKIIFLLFIIPISVSVTYPLLAIETAKVLPLGIHSPAFRSGVITGLKDRFTERGQLTSLTSIYSFELNSSTISRFNTEAQELINILNQFGSSQIGDQIHLGTLQIDLQPKVSYMTPIYAVGVTKKWTVAIGVPIVKYENEVNIIQTNSNINQVRSQLPNVSDELESAFDRLEYSIPNTLQSQLVDKGYKPLKSKNNNFVGDIHLVSLYQYLNSHRFLAMIKNTVILPTGPNDDPDDLLDLEMFGETSVETRSIFQNYFFNNHLSLVSFIGYKYRISDNTTKRVPIDEFDLLPDSSSKEYLRRKIGDTFSLGVHSILTATSYLDFSVGVEYYQKDKDTYSGSSSGSSSGSGSGFGSSNGSGQGNYSLLAKDSESSWNKMVLSVEFSTIESYLKSNKNIPLTVTYEMADVFAATNKEKQTLHEILLTMFF